MPRTRADAKQLLLAGLISACAATHEPGRDGTGGTTTGGTTTGGAGMSSAAERGGEAGSAGDAINLHDAGAGEGGSDGDDATTNGVDFAVWDRYLGKPTAEAPALGINNDPLSVYSIVTLEGEPALRISGEVWGSLISKQSFCNFRLHAEFKWGSAVWPPLNAKDSGIMFLSSGPLGAVNAGGNALSDPIGSGAFMVAAEYQIAAGDVGSLYNLGPIAFGYADLGQHQELSGEWNTIAISFLNDQASLSLNGHETVQASAFMLEWPNQTPAALRCGKLQLQSEGAEIFFRRVQIEQLP